MQLAYKNLKGTLEREESVAGLNFVIWYVRLNDGRLLRGPMNAFIILGESDMTKINPAFQYKEAA